MEVAKLGTRRNPNHPKALLALLSTSSVKEAAEMCGLSDRTLRNYLSDPEFKQAYDHERLRMFAEGVARLVQGATSAADVFIDELKHSDPDIRIRAARSLWEFLSRGVETERRIKELEELERRITQLEEEKDYRGY